MTTQRHASSIVVVLGALATIATSRAPTAEVQGTFERTLAASEAVHVTFHASAPAMDHVRSLGGTVRLVAQTSTLGFSVVPDGTAPAIPVASGGAGTALIDIADCPATGACDVGMTLDGPASGTAAVRIFLRLDVGAQDRFPDGATVVAAED